MTSERAKPGSVSVDFQPSATSAGAATGPGTVPGAVAGAGAVTADTSHNFTVGDGVPLPAVASVRPSGEKARATQAPPCSWAPSQRICPVARSIRRGPP